MKTMSGYIKICGFQTRLSCIVNIIGGVNFETIFQTTDFTAIDISIWIFGRGKKQAGKN
jgi:hypothetical protein